MLISIKNINSKPLKPKNDKKFNDVISIDWPDFIGLQNGNKNG